LNQQGIILTTANAPNLEILHLEGVLTTDIELCLPKLRVFNVRFLTVRTFSIWRLAELVPLPQLKQPRQHPHHHIHQLSQVQDPLELVNGFTACAALEKFEAHGLTGVINLEALSMPSCTDFEMK